MTTISSINNSRARPKAVDAPLSTRSPIECAVPPDHCGPLTQGQLRDAVRHEIRDGVAITDDELDWIVEATLVQLGYGLRRCGGADLRYAGRIIDSECRPPHSLAGAQTFIYTPFHGGSDHDDAA